MEREADTLCSTLEYSTIYRWLIAIISYVIDRDENVITSVITSFGDKLKPRKIPETTQTVTFDKDGSKYAVCPRVQHRNIGHRTVTYEVKRIGKLSRYYYDDIKKFQHDLTQYRSNIGFQKDFSSDGANLNKTKFVCVGLANVRLKFCSLCFDIRKKDSQELYFVDKYDISHHRTILCYGCLGSILLEMKQRGNEG